MDRNTVDTLLNPSGDQLAMLFGTGNGGSRPLGLADRGGQRGILRQCGARVEPTLLLTHSSKGCDLAPPHQPTASNLPIRITLAHAHQDLSILKHLESPACHRAPLRIRLMRKRVAVLR